MSLGEQIGTGLDSFLAIWAPRWAAKRGQARDYLRSKRQYAAAKTSRLTKPWRPVSQDINDLIASSSPIIRERVRQLVRDFPIFTRAINYLVELTVSAGITFQSTIKTPKGEPVKKLQTQIENLFLAWSDECEISGHHDFFSVQQLTKRQEVESGEFLVVKTYPKTRGRLLPFALQVIEADWLSSYRATGMGKNRIHEGIEYDAETGRPVAYHLEDPTNISKPQRIAAENVIHGFDTLRPGQLRGVSCFAPAVLIAHDTDDLITSELDSAKMASKWLAFIRKSEFPTATTTGVGQDPETGKPIEEIENAIIEYLRPGEEVEFSSANRPGQNFEPFIKLLLRLVAVTVGCSYEGLSGDYSTVDYSGLRALKNDDGTKARPWQARHIRQLCDPVFRGFMDMAAISGKLDLPGYFQDPTMYLARTWYPPYPQAVDALKEGKADISLVKAGLLSPQEVARRRQRDIRDIYRELADAKAEAEALDLSFEQVKTPSASNPAALEDQDAKK